MRSSTFLFLAAASAMLPTLRTLDAQSPTTTRTPERRGADVRIERLPDGVSLFLGGTSSSDRNRAVIGVTYAATPGNGAADTAGVRVVSVQSDGPAANSGLKAGDVITDINGVSLHLSAADAADPALAGTAERRLQRAMAKTKAGDDVELRVKTGSASRVVKVKTVSAADLSAQPMRALADGGAPRAPRPTIGLTIGTSGSARDSMGLFISSVVPNGPAERAGVVEGERIAAINGVDVRVPREDVEDFAATEARVQRFLREVQKGEPGSTVTLRVVAGGRSREVSVTTTAASPAESIRSLFRTRDGMPSIQFDFPKGLRMPDGAAEWLPQNDRIQRRMSFRG